jgi:hypothetical protein
MLPKFASVRSAQLSLIKLDEQRACHGGAVIAPPTLSLIDQQGSGAGQGGCLPPLPSHEPDQQDRGRD